MGASRRLCRAIADLALEFGGHRALRLRSKPLFGHQSGLTGGALEAVFKGEKTGPGASGADLSLDIGPIPYYDVRRRGAEDGSRNPRLERPDHDTLAGPPCPRVGGGRSRGIRGAGKRSIRHCRGHPLDPGAERDVSRQAKQAGID